MNRQLDSIIKKNIKAAITKELIIPLKKLLSEENIKNKKIDDFLDSVLDKESYSSVAAKKRGKKSKSSNKKNSGHRCEYIFTKGKKENQACGSFNKVEYNPELEQWRCKTCFKKGKKNNKSKVKKFNVAKNINDSMSGVLKDVNDKANQKSNVSVQEYIDNRKKAKKIKKDDPNPDDIINDIMKGQENIKKLENNISEDLDN